MLKRFHKEIYACSRCGICRAKYTETVRYVCPSGNIQEVLSIILEEGVSG